MPTKKNENPYRWMFREILVPFLATGMGVWLAFYANRVHDEKSKVEKRSRLIEAMLVEIKEIDGYIKYYQKFSRPMKEKVAFPFLSEILESTIPEQVELFKDPLLIDQLNNFKTMAGFLRGNLTIVYDYEWGVSEPTKHSNELAKLAMVRINRVIPLFENWEKNSVKLLLDEYEGQLPPTLEKWVVTLSAAH